MMSESSLNELATNLNSVINMAYGNEMITITVASRLEQLVDMLNCSQTFVLPEQPLSETLNQCSSPTVFKKDKVKTHSESEKDRIMKRLNGFEYKTSQAWIEISKRFGNDVKREDLCEFAKKISNDLNIKLDRDAKRRKDVLLKWFDDNWCLISNSFK